MNAQTPCSTCYPTAPCTRCPHAAKLVEAGAITLCRCGYQAETGYESANGRPQCAECAEREMDRYQSGPQWSGAY